MLGATLGRLSGVPDVAQPLVVCNEAHRFIVAEQLQLMGLANSSTIVLEPFRRDTAPAITIAALVATAAGDDCVLLVLPADHLINDVGEFQRAVAIGAEAAKRGALVTFGVVPRAPETGYGYILASADQEGAASHSKSGAANHLSDSQPLSIEGTFAVEAFIEKPDRATAERYLRSGQYYWNAGIFMFRASRYLAEVERLAPAISDACREASDRAKQDLGFIRIDSDAFEACPADSIDYAVMEKTDSAVVVPLDADWSDVGSWAALWGASQPDAKGNVQVGDVIAHEVTNSYLRGETRLVAAIGLDNHVVIETSDAVLVASKDRVQDVKAVVNALKEKGRDEPVLHRRVHRPWGTYEGICSAARFQVKRIVVHPGASLSLQMHHHRSEHWTVVHGSARVTRGEEVFTLAEDQSTYIPLGTKHRLENPGKIPLEIIEVQTGSYLGEDDIVRFTDVYGRES
jgi:mannose-1-phosphate guanylyltransferase/mannose-6-phosphate isomerase